MADAEGSRIIREASPSPVPGRVAGAGRQATCTTPVVASARYAREGWAVAGIVALAAVLRLIHANAEFWFDEIVTVEAFVRPPLAQTVSSYIANNHVLNSVLAHVLASQFGETPFVVRFPAIAFGIAGVWAFWRFASAVWPARPAVLGTLLFAVSYYAVYYSQNARGYSAFLFFALLATALLRDLLRTREADRRLTRVAYALAVALGLYALPLMVFIAAAHAALLLVWRRWRLLVTLCLALALAAVLYAPMGLSLIEYYRAFPTYTGFPVLSFAFARTLAPIAVALAVGAVAMVPVMGRFAKRDRHAAALLVVPAAFNVLLPVVRGQGVYPRTFIFGLVIAYALLVETLDYLFARRLIGWLAVGAIAALSIAQLVPYYQLPKQGFRQALAYVNEQMLPGDERVGFTLGGKALRFYDSTIRLIDSVDQLRSWTGSAHAPAWILSTFPTQMADDTPELASWLQNETVGKAEFPGVVGDGTVYVHYWVPPKSAAEDTGR